MLTEIALIFLRLGVTGFGGPAVHIALMKDEFVVRRKWLDEPAFLDLLGAASLLPGPTSTELAMHLGYERGGWRGLLVAGICFILPAAALVGGLAALYVSAGSLPALDSVRRFVGPVVLAVVAQALVGLVKPALKSWFLGTLGLGALIAGLLGVAPLLVLMACGLACTLVRMTQMPRPPLRELLMLCLGLLVLAGGTSLLTRLAPQGGSFLTFLQLGSVTYGSGYVLLAFLRDALVTPGVVSERQLLDAIAVGQATPGPVFTTATFLGYLSGGPLGASLATLGIFLPSFVLVGLSAPHIAKLRKLSSLAAFLDGANVGALALMASVLVQLGRSTLHGPLPVVLALVSLGLLLRRVGSAWLLLGGVALGLLAAF
jgi:chromate transporter